MFIPGELADAKQKHKDIEKKFDAKLVNVLYDLNAAKEMIKSKGFDEYMKMCRLIGKDRIAVLYVGGAIS